MQKVSMSRFTTFELHLHTVCLDCLYAASSPFHSECLYHYKQVRVAAKNDKIGEHQLPRLTKTFIKIESHVHHGIMAKARNRNVTLSAILCHCMEVLWFLFQLHFSLLMEASSRCPLQYCKNEN